MTARVLNVTKLAVTGYIDLSLAERPFLSRAGAPVLHHPMRMLATVMAESLLAALVQLGSMATVKAGPGALAFGAVVVLTMFASMQFDPRLIWDPLQKESTP